MIIVTEISCMIPHQPDPIALFNKNNFKLRMIAPGIIHISHYINNLT